MRRRPPSATLSDTPFPYTALFRSVAVFGDGLKFEPMRMTSVDAQMIEQLKWTAEAVCSCFHVPAYKIGVGTPPAYNNIEALQQDYYSTCLQILIEDMELCQDEGLALPANYGTELDQIGRAHV